MGYPVHRKKYKENSFRKYLNPSKTRPLLQVCNHSIPFLPDLFLWSHNVQKQWIWPFKIKQRVLNIASGSYTHMNILCEMEFFNFLWGLWIKWPLFMYIPDLILCSNVALDCAFLTYLILKQDLQIEYFLRYICMKKLL